MTVATAFHPRFAEASSGFSFAGFQQTFHDAWGFVFPNGMLLLLCVAVAWYVGRVKIPSLRTPVDRTKEGVAALAKFLEESNLFGSKLFPALVLLMLVLAALNVFSVLRFASYNVLPPQLTTMPSHLYQRMVDPELFLQVLAKEPGIKYPSDLYRRFHDYEQDLRREAEENHSIGTYYWERDAGEWAGFAGDIKLLTAVAVISCLFGLKHKRWGSIPRCLLAAVLLATGYAYCLAKELYCREQIAYTVISSYRDKILEDGKTDASQLLEQGVAIVDKHPEWLDTTTNASTAWWSLRWINVEFYTRAVELFRGGIDDSGTMHPVFSKERFLSIKERLEWEKKQNPPATVPPPASGTAPKPE